MYSRLIAVEIKTYQPVDVGVEDIVIDTVGMGSIPGQVKSSNRPAVTFLRSCVAQALIRGACPAIYKLRRDTASIMKKCFCLDYEPLQSRGNGSIQQNLVSPISSAQDQGALPMPTGLSSKKLAPLNNPRKLSDASDSNKSKQFEKLTLNEDQQCRMRLVLSIEPQLFSFNLTASVAQKQDLLLGGFVVCTSKRSIKTYVPLCTKLVGIATNTVEKVQ